MNEHRLESLIALLDDPDNSVFQFVLDELLKEDISIIDHLEHLWETSMDELVQKRLELVIKQIQTKNTKKRMSEWANQESIDLFEGFFLISSYQYPELKLKTIQAQLENIRKSVWIEFRNSLTSLEKITVMNHILFDHYRFAVDEMNPDSPQLCYINKVIESHKGNTISIAILYLLVARSLDLPVEYIDFPDHPLIAYFDKETAFLVHGSETEHPLFYINPANKGAIIGPKEVDYIQHTSELTAPSQFTTPCSNRIILKRLIERLISAYNKLGLPDKVSRINEISSIL